MRPHQVVALVVFVAVAHVAPASAQPYAVVPIEGPEGFHTVVPTDINNRLEVVGYAWGTAGARPFIWDLVNGFRLLPILRSGYLRIWIDDASVVYGQREVDGVVRFTKLINGEAHDFPTPPGDTVESIVHVTNNGIVLMYGQRSWGLVGDTLYDLNALTGASVSAVNEQGVLGGCKGGRGYVRTPDGRERYPWTTAPCVSRIGPAGHFATSQVWDFNPTFKENPAYYGTPDGRVWTIASFSPPFLAVSDVNAAGTIVGWQHSSLGGDERPLTIDSDGQLNYLNSVVLSPTWRGRVAYAINDAGYIVATGSGAALLVPTAPLAPSSPTFQVTGQNVQLRWERTPGAAEYIIEAGTTPGASDFYTGSVGNVTAITAVVPSGRYYVRIRARTSAGLLTSPSRDVVIDVLPASVPAPPTGLTVIATHHVGVVQWQPSPGATDYIVEAGTAPGASNLFNGSVGSQPYFSAMAPPPGRYYVRVRARNITGVSAPSEEIIIDVP
jgi:hypothetical protein